MTDLGHLTRDICGPSDPGDRWVADLAGRQHGVVCYWQLIGLRLGPDAIQYRVATGRLHRLYRGVYAVGHPVLSREGRWMAAVLACGEGAVLSHRDAAMLHNLRRTSRRDIDVTTLRGRARRHDGITLHRVRRLHPEDRSFVAGIPVTSVARTLLDLAEVVGRDHLERAVENAERLELFDLRAIERLRRRSRGRRGLKPLKAVIAAYRAPAPFNRSNLERAFLNAIRAAGIPDPAMNLWIEGYEVDAIWQQEKLIVELDGGVYHGTTGARRRDPVRDARLQLAGYRVIRVSDEWLERDPEA